MSNPDHPAGTETVPADQMSEGKGITLQDLRGSTPPPSEFDTQQPLEIIVAHFDAHPEEVGVLIVKNGSFVYLISREWTATQLARPYFRELFLRRPVELLMRTYGLAPVELPENTMVSAAIEAALARPAAARYEPLVVTTASKTRWILDVYSLLLTQCQVLTSTLHDLERQRTATAAAYEEREKLQQRLLDASREAGRAEVATGILHNVGNVLNSVNVSAAMINKTLQQSKLGNLSKSVALFEENRDRLATFLSDDERGRRLPGYLAKLAGALAAEQGAIVEEMNLLGQRLEHVRQVVAMQQSYAKDSNVREPVRPADLMEDALRVNLAAFDRHNVQVLREYGAFPPMPLDKHKVLQILINLVSNAKNAVKHCNPGEKRITLKIETVAGAQSDDPMLLYRVIDNGIGIPAENLTRIFTHGFTTRKEGHGFGLHSAANAAREMGGALTATSDGAGKGATFTLVLPIVAGLPTIASEGGVATNGSCPANSGGKVAA